MVTKKDIEKVLKTIPDPELQVSIWDLGLVYEVSVNKKGVVEIIMTLTSIGCPLFSLIEESVKREVGQIKGVKKVNIELTFDPPWSPEKMSKKAKALLGF